MPRHLPVQLVQPLGDAPEAEGVRGPHLAGRTAVRFSEGLEDQVVHLPPKLRDLRRFSSVDPR